LVVVDLDVFAMDKAEVNLFNGFAWGDSVALKRIKHCKRGNKSWRRKRIMEDSRGIGRGFRSRRSRRGRGSMDLGEEERPAFNYVIDK